MEINHEKLNIIDISLIILSLLSVFIIPWYSGNSLSRSAYLVLILYTLYLVFKFKYYKYISIYGYIIMILNALIVILNLVINGMKQHTLLSLVFTTYINLIIIIFFSILDRWKNIGLKKFIDKYLFILFNVYFIINIPILIVQVNNKYFMMKFISNNAMYKDHITGLIGQSGTHVLGFFWICLLILNLYKINQNKNKILILLTMFEFIFMIIISSYNDNTAFYFLIIIVFIEFYLDKLIKINIQSFFKYTILFISVIFLFLVIKNYNSNLQNFYNNRILTKLEQYTGQSNNVKDERIALFQYALKHGNGYMMGKGIGSILTYGDPNLPKHFGMNEISLKTYEGGIIYLILIITIYTYFSNQLLGIGKGGSVILFINFLMFSIYTEIFRDFRLILLFTIILLIYKYNYLEQHGSK